MAAYLGQVGNVKSKKILGAAGSILPIEARLRPSASGLRGEQAVPSVTHPEGIALDRVWHHALVLRQGRSQS